MEEFDTTCDEINSIWRADWKSNKAMITGKKNSQRVVSPFNCGRRSPSAHLRESLLHLQLIISTWLKITELLSCYTNRGYNYLYNLTSKIFFSQTSGPQVITASLAVDHVQQVFLGHMATCGHWSYLAPVPATSPRLGLEIARYSVMEVVDNMGSGLERFTSQHAANEFVQCLSDHFCTFFYFNN